MARSVSASKKSDMLGSKKEFAEHGKDGNVKANAGNGKTKKKPATNRIKEALETTTITVHPLNLGRMKLTLQGTSPLVVHNFSEASRRHMLEKQMKKDAKKNPDPRCPEEEFLQALYWIDGSAPKPHVNKETGERFYKEGEVIKALKKGTFGVPAAGLKNALISACRNTDLTMTMMRQAVFVNGIEDPDWLIIKSPRLPEMDSRICRLSGTARTPQERFRPMWKEWQLEIRCEWDRGLLSEEQLVNLIAISGFFVGLCEGRPERSSLGWGRFEVV